jgi:hypothetical protein
LASHQSDAGEIVVGKTESRSTKVVSKHALVHEDSYPGLQLGLVNCHEPPWMDRSATASSSLQALATSVSCPERHPINSITRTPVGLNPHRLLPALYFLIAQHRELDKIDEKKVE